MSGYVELARRLCETDRHNAFGIRPDTVPCVMHLQQASRLWSLVKPEGQPALKVLVQLAKENGAWTD